MVEIQQDDLNPLLNSFHEGICYLSPQAELLHSNEMARRHWHIEHQSASNLIRQPPVASALAGEYVQHELIHLNEQHSLLVNTLPLHSATNTLKGVVVISQDVSEHLLVERQAQMALDVLMQVILDIHGSDENDEIDEVLRRIAVLIPQLESVDNSIALRVDDTSGRVLPLALFGSSQQSYEEWHAELSALELNLEHALQQSSPAYLQALRLGRPLMFNFTSSPTLNNPRNLRAAIYAPVLLNGRAIGLLGAERHRPLNEAAIYFPQWGVELLTALARVASMTIEKSVLLRSIERMQGELDTARSLLSQRDEFLSLTAHELKNPLTAIRGQAQILRRYLQRMLHPGTTSPQASNDLIKGLNSIEHQSRKIEHMINTLLDISRLDLDRLELELQQIDLVQVARRVLAEQLPYAARNHELRLFVNGQPVPIAPDNTPPAPPLRLEADEEKLDQVLTNLVSNAIKYSPQDGPITVSIQQTGNSYVEIAVEDKGIGIPPEAQLRLTERFFRAENARNVDSKGLGLGLYLVNALVTKHGGVLSIKSEGISGKGSTFIVRLPYSQQ